MAAILSDIVVRFDYIMISSLNFYILHYSTYFSIVLQEQNLLKKKKTAIDKQTT